VKILFLILYFLKMSLLMLFLIHLVLYWNHVKIILHVLHFLKFVHEILDYDPFQKILVVLSSFFLNVGGEEN